MDDQQKVVLDLLHTIQYSIDHLDTNLDQDRRDIQEFRLRLKALESQVEEVRGQLHDLPAQVGEEVSDTTRPIVEQTKSLTETLKGKRFVPFDKPPIIKRIVTALQRRGFL